MPPMCSNAADVKAFSQILSFGSEDQRLAYQRLQDPYTLFAALGESDPFLAGAVLHYKGVVLDSIIEDRLLAEAGKEEANRNLVKQLNAKKRIVAQLSLQKAGAAPKEASERIQTLEQELENIEGKLARQGTDLGQARRALTITVEQVQAVIPNDTVLVEYVRYFHYLGKSKFEWRYEAVVLSIESVSTSAIVSGETYTTYAPCRRSFFCSSSHCAPGASRRENRQPQFRRRHLLPDSK